MNRGSTKPETPGTYARQLPSGQIRSYWDGSLWLTHQGGPVSAWQHLPWAPENVLPPTTTAQG